MSLSNSTLPVTNLLLPFPSGRFKERAQIMILQVKWPTGWRRTLQHHHTTCGGFWGLLPGSIANACNILRQMWSLAHDKHVAVEISRWAVNSNMYSSDLQWMARVPALPRGRESLTQGWGQDLPPSTKSQAQVLPQSMNSFIWRNRSSFWQ